MILSGKKYRFIRTFIRRVDAQREASRWLVHFSAKIIRTPTGRYSVYVAPVR